MRVAIGILGLASIPCASAADSGFYLGIGTTYANYKDQVANPNGSGTIDFDASSNGYKAFGGYRLKALPLLDFAAEAGYHYFGKAMQTTPAGQNVSYSLDGGSASGLVILPIGPVDLFGKGGAFYSRLNKNIDGTNSSRTGTNTFYGAGIGFHIGRLGLRAEYEYFDVSNLNRAQMYSLSGVFQF
jgi:hypothetical protein